MQHRIHITAYLFPSSKYLYSLHLNYVIAFVIIIFLLADFVMVMVIYGSHKFKVNPDNVATPLAASIGDIVSNTVLAVTAQYMFEQIREYALNYPHTVMCICFQICKEISQKYEWTWLWVDKERQTKEMMNGSW